MSKEKEVKSKVGIVFSLITIVGLTPIWAALHWWILTMLNAPTWIWVLFWIYVPLAFSLGMARGICELAIEMAFNEANQEGTCRKSQ